MDIAFDRIHRAIDDYLTHERINLLDSILTDFKEECKDQKTIEKLENILNYYRGKSPQSSVASSPARCFTSAPIFHTIDFKPCNAIIKSGMRQGQMCGSKASLNGFCKRHEKSDKTEKTEKSDKVDKGGVQEVKKRCTFCIEEGKICGKPISIHSPSDSYCRLHVKDELSLDTKKYIISLNKFGNMEHKYSSLVFENKKVIGSQHPSGTITNTLNDEDLECVLVYGLPISDEFKPQMASYLNRKNISK